MAGALAGTPAEVPADWSSLLGDGKKPRDALLKLRGYDPIPEGIVVFRFERREEAG